MIGHGGSTSPVAPQWQVAVYGILHPLPVAYQQISQQALQHNFGNQHAAPARSDFDVETSHLSLTTVGVGWHNVVHA